jgi:hypothetical protein
LFVPALLKKSAAARSRFTIIKTMRSGPLAVATRAAHRSKHR